MPMRCLSWLAIPVFCASLAAAPAAKFSFADSNGKLTLADAGKPVFVYNYGPVLGEGFPEAMRRSTYLHPVWLPDGRVITDDFNKDHPHHRGISWMWPVVVVDGKTYDLWTVAGIRQRFLKWTARETKGGHARLGVSNGWFVDERKVPRRAGGDHRGPGEGWSPRASSPAAFRAYRRASRDRRHTGRQ